MRSSRLPALVAALALGVLAALAPSGSATAVSAASAVPAASSSGVAAKPAPVRITLKRDITGRVISDRAACVRQRPVFLFAVNGGEVAPVGSTLTDAQGRYPTEMARRGVPPGTKATTLVTGDARCRVAQSRMVPFPTGRAARQAKRKITFQAGQTGATGRVTSKRAGCVKDVPIVLFVQTDPSQPFQPGNTTTTDNQGRYSFGQPRFRQQDVKLFTVALGDDACRVAQSPTRTISGGVM